jgi:hypothetical protein
MTAGKAPASRTLATRPDLDQLRRQAKELLAAYRAGDADAIAEVRARYHDADPEQFALHHAQLVLAEIARLRQLARSSRRTVDGCPRYGGWWTRFARTIRAGRRR